MSHREQLSAEVRNYCVSSPSPAACMTPEEEPVCVADPSSIIYVPIEPLPVCEQPLPPQNATSFAALPPDPCAPMPGQNAFVPEDNTFQAILSQLRSMPLAQRLECVSRRFLGTPYKLDPLGEGNAGLVDQDPMFRFDALDCMTYVEEVLAMSHATSFDTFLGTLQSIRYHGGVGTYGLRNHFVEADWIDENSGNGFLRDITVGIGGELAGTMDMPIDRAGWIDNKENLSQCEKSTARMELAELGLGGPQQVVLDFLPLSAFFGDCPEADELNSSLIDMLPEVSIAVFLRKEEAAKKFGVMVAHMGLLLVPVQKDGSRGEPMLRHASSRANAVIEEPLLPYLKSQENIRAGVTILEPREKP